MYPHSSICFGIILLLLFWNNRNSFWMWNNIFWYIHFNQTNLLAQMHSVQNSIVDATDWPKFCWISCTTLNHGVLSHKTMTTFSIFLSENKWSCPYSWWLQSCNVDARNKYTGLWRKVWFRFCHCIQKLLPI